MNVEETTISGVYRIHPRVHVDGRGEFWRAFCREQLGLLGIGFDVCQSNVSVNQHRHTLRGFHYQRPPSAEQKILTVVTGSVEVAIVDVRGDSATCGRHEIFRFDDGDRSSLLVAAGCATGFLTLADQTIVHYQMSDFYQPDAYTGFRFDDPQVGVRWSAEPAVISERDLELGPFVVSEP
ncbi:MAG: dTDP-4-dehydrorhamnose 3,5-epimerase [Rhodospirillaceae bacterium]|mgnify:CR=1 FL=1|nr:dTDP-4-dehydrorhamnose 3,5-epimerase [Rhodospirillaceae bacterium]